ncbi:MAG TPA: hypothetical protein VMC44_06995 [Geobacteraceae bacterium]|nr:hypothetical protein [Geobacteraceae bacterium]
MKKYRRILTRALSLFILIIWTAPCSAAESAVKEMWQDTMYGGLTGTLIGAAVMAFTKRAGDHLDYLGYGAAGGALVGAAVGLTLINKSLAEVEHGKVKFAIPAVIPEVKDTNAKGISCYVINAELLSGKF